MNQALVASLQEMIDKSNRIVFFGGAGVSTESGIPDFRSVDGLYNQKYDYPPEQILSHTFFMTRREAFYQFYYDKILLEGAEPNAAHFALSELEKKGKLTAVITQNIDGLHQKAGSRIVYELHGSIQRNYCMSCHTFFDGQEILKQKEAGEPIPKCAKCGGDIKPDVVLYEEGLDDEVVSKSVEAISTADMLIIGGTSLVVYPAAGLINYYKGNRLVLINKSETSQDKMADLILHEPIGEVFSALSI